MLPLKVNRSSFLNAKKNFFNFFNSLIKAKQTVHQSFLNEGDKPCLAPFSSYNPVNKLVAMPKPYGLLAFLLQYPIKAAHRIEGRNIL